LGFTQYWGGVKYDVGWRCAYPTYGAWCGGQDSLLDIHCRSVKAIGRHTT